MITAQKSTETLAHALTYDTAGRLSGESSPLFGAISATLDANGNTTSQVYPASAAFTVSFTYDQLNRMSTVYQGTVATGTRIGGYSYNTLSQRSAISYGPATSPLASTAATYTNAGQLASLGHVWTGSSLTLSYTYNADHQRTGVAASDRSYLPSGLAPATSTYTTNALNQYAAVTGTTYVYDKAGNLTSDGVWSFGYDTENRLISAANAGTGAAISYAYDALDRRKWKVVNGIITAWPSFGNREIAEYVGTGAISLTRNFVYGPGLDEPVASFTAGGAPNYYFQDALGSTVALANGVGAVAEIYAYTAFGKTVVAGPSAPYRFTGRRFDEETGLYFYRARAYSATLGRFLQTDPKGVDGGINLYAYTGNDPVNATDPTGLYTLQIGFGGSGTFCPFCAALFGGGIAFDTSGNIGFYGYGGVGGQIGLEEGIGGSVQVSNAQTIYDLSGPFYNGSVHGGIGIGGSIDGFTGSSEHGLVTGFGITFGLSIGASAVGGLTTTEVCGFAVNGCVGPYQSDNFLNNNNPWPSSEYNSTLSRKYDGGYTYDGGRPSK